MAGDAYDARVLEPSPPAVNEGPWFADDPVARGDATRPVLWPVSSRRRDVGVVRRGGRGARRVVPGALARPVSARWRRSRRASRRPGSRCTRSPSTSSSRRARRPTARSACDTCAAASARRSSATTRRCRSRERSSSSCAATRPSSPLTTLAAAARRRRLGEPPAGGVRPPAARRRCRAVRRPAARLSPTLRSTSRARFIGDWFGFAYSVLEELRARATRRAAPSRVQLWPEHFDAALELGDEAAGARAAYGCSPGDEHHPEPYLYVAPWTARPTGELWNAQGFPGAELAVRRPPRRRRPARAGARVLRGAGTRARLTAASTSRARPRP